MGGKTGHTTVTIPNDDPRLTRAIIPAFVIAGLLEIASAEALPTADWFAGTGLTARQMQQPDTLLSYRQAATVIRRALHRLPPGPHGLRVGSREALVSFGMPGFAMLSSRTVGEAMAIGLQYHQATGSLMDVEAELGPVEVALRLRQRVPDAELLPFLCEEAFAGTCTLLRAMLGRETTPLRIELGYPAPAYAGAYTRVLGCPVLFGREANRLVLDAMLLDRPLAAHSPANVAAALQACQRLAAPDDARPDVVTVVETLLRENLRQRLTMADIAHRLNITERTLRRRLDAAGEHFAAIRERVLRQHAHVLLRESPLPIATIAADLGFGDVRDFRRAFRRWTGMAPTALRRQDKQA